MSLPPLPARDLLADLCREAAARERVEPQLIEKDFFLTRLLSAFADHSGDALLLKGGTLLSKVDLGFLRMSEDADYVLAGAPSRERRANARRMDLVRRALQDVKTDVGIDVPFPGGDVREKSAHVIWELRYPSDFGAQRIQLEVTIRPVLRRPRRAPMWQLVSDPLIGDYGGMTCWALDADEARAEKVRAAFTREAIRDFYDLDRFAEAGADFTSRGFLSLVDAKLAELGAAPLEHQGPRFALTPKRRATIESSLAAELPAVLRRDAPTFDLEAMLGRFDRMWSK